MWLKRGGKLAQVVDVQQWQLRYSSKMYGIERISVNRAR